MANHKSAKKAHIQSLKVTERRKAHSSRIKTFIKKFEQALSQNNLEIAKPALQTAQSELMHGVTKGIVKLNAASRKISRLNAKLKNLATSK